VAALFLVCCHVEVMNVFLSRTRYSFAAFSVAAAGFFSSCSDSAVKSPVSTVPSSVTVFGPGEGPGSNSLNL
jgi:hypothetical protein